MDLLFDWQHYHRLNVILLSAIGLWPYGNKLVIQLKRLVSCFFVLMCCFCQLTTFFTVDYTRTILLRNIPCIFVGCGVLFKYISFLSAVDCIKVILEGINSDWKGLSSKEEIQIIKKYIERSKFHTKGFAMFVCPLGVCLVLLPLSSTLLDIVMPLNQPRRRTFPIMVDYLFDQNKYFFLAVFLFDGTIIVAGFVLVSTEALSIAYVQHACALFELTSCRIKKLLYAEGVKDSKNNSNSVMIEDVVSIHCRAIRHCKTLREDLLQSYIVLLVFGILSLGAYIFRCTETFASKEYPECLTSAMFCIAILGYMFYMNFVLQNALDSSGDIFDDLYNSAWCDVPIATRKLILFCMINCMKPVTFDVCSLFVPCFKGFSIIVRMTMSYATALFSFQ